MTPPQNPHNPQNCPNRAIRAVQRRWPPGGPDLRRTSAESPQNSARPPAPPAGRPARRGPVAARAPPPVRGAR
ncbi:hypothetical protein APASM_2027 [Actinosynnema pretiosum subsp. pretiosum]|nr:hypothetical protein APASM_2027 [Actinosynnema pretiosum subsp. pretiosum]